MRSTVEHVFAHQKNRMRLTVGAIGVARAGAAVRSAKMTCNMTRWR